MASRHTLAVPSNLLVDESRRLTCALRRTAGRWVVVQVGSRASIAGAVIPVAAVEFDGEAAPRLYPRPRRNPVVFMADRGLNSRSCRPPME